MKGTAGASMGKWSRYIEGADADPALTVTQNGSGLLQSWVNSSGTGVTSISSTGQLAFVDSIALAFGTGSDSKIYFDATDTIWDLGSGDLMIAQAGSFPSPDAGAVHFWWGTAGTVNAPLEDGIIIESAGSAMISFLAPDNATIYFGDAASNSAARIRYQHSGNILHTYIGGSAILSYSSGAFAFQEPTIISTTSGDLTLDPAGDDVILRDSTALAFGTGADSRVYYDGTDTFWDLSAVGTGDLMVASAASFPSPDPGVAHFWWGTAGSVASKGDVGITIEAAGGVMLQFLSPDSAERAIWFGEASDSDAGAIVYNSAVSDGFVVRTGGANSFTLVGGATPTLDFLGPATISTDSGALTLAPTTDTKFTSGDVLVGTGNNVTVGGLFDGASSGTPELQLAKSADLGSLLISGHHTTDTYGPALVFLKSGNSTASSAGGSFGIVADDELLGYLTWAADDGVDYLAQAASIRVHIDGSPSTSSMPGRMSFWTTADGAATPTERMRISPAGGVYLTEIAAADTDIAAKGQIWVKNTTPNELWFTDDAGTDHQVEFV